MADGQHIQGSVWVGTAASGSATIFASTDAGRWHLQRGFVTVITPNAGDSLNVMEAVDASAAATIFSVPVVTAGMAYFDLGEHGYAASQPSSRLVVELTADASINALFIGYVR